VVGYLVATHAARVLIEVPPQATADLAGRAVDLAAAAFRDKELSKLSVPLGLLSGLFAGWAYNRWSDFRLPSYLAFFGGRRFVPIVCGFAGLGLGLLFGVAWPAVEHGMDVTSQAVLGSESLGLFAYGVLNRVLIVTGLHHIINNIAWFLLGDYNGVTGDLKRFFAGDPSAGAFMSGFFPVMMFGLPGACLAMYRTAAPEKRKAVGGMLFSMALTSFLTGVTEPIEFSFMFLAPLLYAIHAVLTGIAMALMHALGVHLGFGFSAGLFDYVLNFSLSTRPWMLIPVGLAYFGLYYGLFRYFIVRFDLKTLGRETDETAAPPVEAGGSAPAFAWIQALGSAANLVSVEACTTRLRLVVADTARIDERAVKALGSRGVLKLADGAVQVVVGPIADQLASEIREALRRGPSSPASVSAVQPDPGVMARVLQALGGRANIAELQHRGSRLCISVRDPAAVNESALYESDLGNSVRAIARPAPGSIHLVIGPAAITWFAEMKPS
jgi:N-acetylglucosamine PTS system EIICBA or EIICB component